MLIGHKNHPFIHSVGWLVGWDFLGEGLGGTDGRPVHLHCHEESWVTKWSGKPGEATDHVLISKNVRPTELLNPTLCEVRLIAVTGAVRGFVRKG